MRLIQKAGVLEFRMAPWIQGQSRGSEYVITQAEAKEYLAELAAEGPDPGHKRGDPFQWFPIHGEDEKFGGVVVGEYAGRRYLLLSNNSSDIMLNPPGNSQWQLTSARPGSDSLGKPCVNFSFDSRGAAIFSKLTNAHKQDDSRGRAGDLMAILLDDEVYSAPSIHSMISDSGQITGSFTQQEVQELVNTFDAGSLPAKLNPDPVSISQFASAMGDINKKQSIRAGTIALIAVAVFMIGYYFLSGVIADLALALNLVLIMGIMAWFNAVFTMPGIAGLILTIGMAVDSNVLINERLREEQDRGLPIRLAFKNAYDRAFSAIFDSHLTALITCLVLYWVGTEEVKGFALTLGLGVALNLFTAVFVTKWIVMVMLGAGMIRSHQYMLRLIHVPKIDWMAKRYYFWAFSLVTALLGIVALISEGGRIWGIEFSAGTQATVVFKDDGLIHGALPNDRLVEDAIKKTAGDMDNTKRYAKLHENVRVETVIDPNKVEKFMKAFGADKPGDKITRSDWVAHHKDPKAFDLLDVDHTGI